MFLSDAFYSVELLPSLKTGGQSRSRSNLENILVLNSYVYKWMLISVVFVMSDTVDSENIPRIDP